MDNKLQITALLDSSKFDQQMTELQRKIKNLRETGPGGSFAQLSQSFRSQGNEQAAQRVEAYRQKQDAANRNSIQNDYKRQEQMLQRMISLEERISSRIAEKGKATKYWVEQQEILNQKIQQTATLMSNMQKTEGIGGGGGPGGIGGGASGGLGGLLKSIGLPKILGAIGTAVGYSGQLYKAVATQPERTTKNEANIANMLSESSRLQMQRRGYEMSLFAPERIKALERANTRVGAEKTSDATGLGATVLASAGIGAGVGSFFPIVGTGIGAGIGAAVGFGGAMLSDRKRNMLFNREAYDKEMGSVFAGTYQDQFNAERAKSYQKDLAAQTFQSNAGTFRSLQRGFGLSDEALFKGDNSLLQRSAKSGYDLDSISGAMQGISSAGGGTRLSVNGAQIAAQLQRSLDLTNAPSLIGRIGGAGSGRNEIQSKDEIIRMYSEATKIGLDTSETRDYLQTAADMGYKTGGDLQTIAKMLSTGIQSSGNNGPRGIEAATSALERIKQETSQMGGLGGQYGIAALQGGAIKKALGGEKGLNDNETAYLLGTDPTKIGDDYLKSLLESRKQKADDTSVSNLRKEITKAKFQSTTRTKEQEEAIEKFRDMSENRKNGTGKYTKEKERSIEAGYLGVMSKVKGEGFTGLSKEEQFAYGGEVGSGLRGGGTTSKDVTSTEGKLKEGKGRMGDLSESSAASDFLAQLSNLTDQAGKLNEAFEANIKVGTEAKKAADGLAHLATILEKMNPEAREEVQKNLKVEPKKYGPK